MSKDELAKVMESKFYSPAGFAEEIEALVQVNKNMNYIDAIVHFCDKNSIDVESVPKLIPKPLKEKIKFDSNRINFLNVTSRAKWFLIPKKSEKHRGYFSRNTLSRL